MPQYLVKFMIQLKIVYGEEYLNSRRLQLIGPTFSDLEWAEYCFSSESPF